MARAMKVAIVDDQADMRQSISQWLALSGFDTETYASAEEALKGIGPEFPGVVVSDIKMPGMDGMAFLKRLMGMDSGLPVIMITGHGDVPMAVEAMRVGAYDFLEKPFNPDRMTELAKRATQARRLTGVAATALSDLFLATGALIDFGNGNSVITHSTGVLTASVWRAVAVPREPRNPPSRAGRDRNPLARPDRPHAG